MIGIDIGSKFIKVCKILKEKKSAYSILCAMTPSSEEVGVQSDKISALLRKLKISKDSCCMAVGGKNIICRDLLIPAKINKKDLKNAILVEAGQSVTEDLSKMFTAFTLMKSNPESKDTYLYSACPRNKIIPKMSALRGIRELEIESITMESLALANAFNVFGPNYKNTESIMLVNIGAVNTNIIVLNSKELVFMRDIDFGGDNITAEINAAYSIPSKLSEEIKRRNDIWHDIGFSVKNSLKKSSANLLEAVFRAVEYCIAKQLLVAVDRIVLTGGGAALEGIDSFVEETLGIPTAKWNPLANIECAGYVNKDYGLSIPVALGLALGTEKENV